MKSKLTVADILKGGFSTPWDAPTVPSFPFRFRSAEILTLYYRTIPEAANRLLPPPLKIYSEVVAIHIYKMNDTDWVGPYGECNVMFGASIPSGEIGGYSPYFFLSSEVGVCHGREIHGQPKKLANPRLEYRGDLIVGTVIRNGIEIITGTMAYKQKQSDPSILKKYFDSSLNFNLKAIDHINGEPAIRQITSRRLTDIHIHECWTGPCTVELRANVQAPVFRLPVHEFLDGVFWKADFTLIPGEIIIDYLKDKHDTSGYSN